MGASSLVLEDIGGRGVRRRVMVLRHEEMEVEVGALGAVADAAVGEL